MPELLSPIRFILAPVMLSISPSLIRRLLLMEFSTPIFKVLVSKLKEQRLLEGILGFYRKIASRSFGIHFSTYPVLLGCLSWVALFPDLGATG